MPTGAPVYRQEAAKTRRDQLILDHLPLVKHAVGRLVERLPAGVDKENLESAGILGLVEAATRFDPQRGVKFETFAYMRIRGAVVDEMRRNSCLPQQMIEYVAKVRRAYQKLPAPATVEALAESTGMSEDQVVDCLAAMRINRTVSLENMRAGGEGNLEQGDDRPEQHAEQEELHHLLARAVAALPERQRLVVTLYYVEDLRLKEIGAVVGLSESRVSRVLSASLFQLGEELRASGM